MSSPAIAPSGVKGLTPEQQAALEEFKKELEGAGALDKKRMSDQWLLRFLRARKWNVANAKKMILAAELWRKENNVNNILEPGEFDFEEKAQVNKYYPQYYHKQDKDGRPVYIERLGQVNMTELRKITTEERQLKALVYEYERFLHVRLPACSEKAGHLVETSCTILDLKGVGIKAFWDVKDYVQKTSYIGQYYYPETMGKFYIINAPWTFSTAWSLISNWLDPVTVAKISILSGDGKKELLAQIPAENLPADLGGTCVCSGPGGCSMSDAGPWLRKDDDDKSQPAVVTDVAQQDA